jgi:ABC-2 type transport system ATP-binding protein
LILDEPTVGLDVVVRDDILDEIREYMEKNEERTVIISSHISSDVEKLCDTITMIHDGKIVFMDDTDRLLSEYAALKIDEEAFKEIDKSHIKAYKKEKYGYECLTDEKEYYIENYPSIVVEKMSVDEMMTIIIKGEKA